MRSNFENGGEPCSVNSHFPASFVRSFVRSLVCPSLLASLVSFHSAEQLVK